MFKEVRHKASGKSRTCRNYVEGEQLADTKRLGEMEETNLHGLSRRQRETGNEEAPLYVYETTQAWRIWST
jgi:hypothetical protein